MIIFIWVTLDVIGENLTGRVIEGYMESVIKLMLMPRNEKCESGFTWKGKAILKRCVCSVLSANYKWPGDILSSYTHIVYRAHTDIDIHLCTGFDRLFTLV